MKIKFLVYLHVLYPNNTWSLFTEEVGIDEEWIPEGLNEYEHLYSDEGADKELEFERQLQMLAEQVLWPDGLSGRIVYLHHYKPVDGYEQFSTEEDEDYYA